MSGRPESNRHLHLGRVGHYHYATPACGVNPSAESLSGGFARGQG